jgi:glycosyltransferase involved in cell wall biosynthesis
VSDCAEIVARKKYVRSESILYKNGGLKNSLDKKTVSIIIPAFNEEKTIGTVLHNIEKLQQNMPSIEVVVVDDGSQDKTADEIARFSFAKCVKHKENRGKGSALCTGFSVATGDIFVIQDADMEYSPLDIPKLLKPILHNVADVVYGSRLIGSHKGMSLTHYIGNKILSLTSRLLIHAPVTDVMTGHKCMTREVVETLTLKEDGFGIEIEITAQIFRNGWRFQEIPIAYSKRRYGISKIGYKDGFQSMRRLLAYSLQNQRSARQYNEQLEATYP